MPCVAMLADKAWLIKLASFLAPFAVKAIRVCMGKMLSPFAESGKLPDEKLTITSSHSL